MRLLAVLLILVAGVAYYFATTKTQSVLEPIPEPALGAPTFSWLYEAYDTPDIPYTDISLTVSYENGVSETKRIDRVEGSCNDYESDDSAVYERSTMIICYYAGLGRYFRVVVGEGEYLVQRRIFEEASPDYAPPQQPYETIERF